MLGIRSSRDQVSLRASLKVELTGKPGCRDSLADVDRVKAPVSRAAGTGQPPASALIVLWMGSVEMHNDERVTRPGKWTEMQLRTRPFCPPDPSARRHDATDEDAQHGCHVVPRPPRGADGLTGLVACLGMYSGGPKSQMDFQHARWNPDGERLQSRGSMETWNITAYVL